MPEASLDTKHRTPPVWQDRRFEQPETELSFVLFSSLELGKQPDFSDNRNLEASTRGTCQEGRLKSESRMLRTYLVRVGAFGHVGRFRAVDPGRFLRTSRVVCRTRRGLEVGEVLAEEPSVSVDECDGSLLRRMTVEDDLLLARLDRYRDDAYAACVQELQEQSLDAQLMDVEHLFDGQSIYFYFLGEVNEQIEAITSELAGVYESQVQIWRFTDNVIAGCGPGCGTEDAANGCGTDCGSCAIVGACSSSKESR